MTDESRRAFLRQTTAASLGGYVGVGYLGNGPTALRDDALDEALRRLANTGPNYGPGFANHGPMAAEALVAMDRPAAVAGFLDRYVPHLQPAPAPGKPFAPEEIEKAFGDSAAYARFHATFARELAEQPWREVVGRRAAQLVPGLMGALAHGIIRTVHASRAMIVRETPERRDELARALAYWASNCRPVLGEPGEGREKSLDVLKRIPLLPDEKRRAAANSSEQRLSQVMQFPPFLEVAATCGAVEAAVFIRELLDTTARLFVQNGGDAPIFFLHGVTGVAATEVLLPLLDEKARQRACGHAWRLVAAMQSRMGSAPFRGDDVAAPEGPVDDTVNDCIDRAVANGDEHAIKITSACVLAFQATKQPALLAAAKRGTDLM